MYRHRLLPAPRRMPSAACSPLLLPTPTPSSRLQSPNAQRPTPLHVSLSLIDTHRHRRFPSVGVRESATPANVETTALHSPILRSSFLPMTHSRVSRSAQGSAQHIRESVLFATVLPPVFLSLFSIFLLEGRQVWEQTAPLDLLHDVHKLSEPHDPVVPRAPHF